LTQPNRRDKAYDKIKGWITHYDLKPGSHLRFDHLSTLLEMSQTPIREAISKLEQEHFIERLPQGGYVVRSLELQEVSDIFDLRIALEVLAAEQAAARMTQDDQERLAHIINQVERLVDGSSRDGILELEQGFHLSIMRASGNCLLHEIGQGIMDRILMIQNINILTSNRLLDAHRQHEEIFETLKKRDSRKAGRLMKNHVSNAKKYIMARMRDPKDFLSKLISGFPEQS